MRMIYCLLLMPIIVCAQRPVIVSFPSLRIPASSRGLSMGDCGIATAAENQQLFYNAAKTAFVQNFHQASVNYTPWLSAVSGDTRFINMNYVGNVMNTSAIGLSVSYLNLGTMAMRDNNGATIAEYKAREYHVGASYALQLNNNASLAVGLRLLGQNAFTDVPKNILSVCGDLSYYQFVMLGEEGRKLEWGATVSNVGPKIGLGDNANKNFLPMNLGVGVGYSSVDESNAFSFGLDFNKLLVPSSGDDKGILAGMFASFRDPDQLQLIRISSGLEYGYMKEFFLRGGVSLENKNYGNRTYFGLGVGYKGLVLDQSWGLDFHCLVPFGTMPSVSPFQNSFGFSLKLSFGNFQ
jgi:hypothetical protein